MHPQPTRVLEESGLDSELEFRVISREASLRSSLASARSLPRTPEQGTGQAEGQQVFI